MFTSYVKIDKEALSHNIHIIKNEIGDALLCAVVKADAYGHGLVETGKVFDAAGADWLAVTTMSEAVSLASSSELSEKIRRNILLLGTFTEEELPALLESKTVLTLYNLHSAELLRDALLHRPHAEVRVHFKIDTGMNRLGFRTADEVYEAYRLLDTAGEVRTEGIFSHFSKSSDPDKSESRRQASLFMQIVSALEERGLVFPIKHISNSGALLELPEYCFDMVRIGILCYGLYPNPQKRKWDLREAMSLCTRVASVKMLRSGDAVSYDGLFRGAGGEVVVNLPVGYADGLSRRLRGLPVKVGARTGRIVGTICMNQVMVLMDDMRITADSDLTVLPREGEEVTVFSQKDGLSINRLSEMLDTIPYEVICTVGRSLPKVYF